MIRAYDVADIRAAEQAAMARLPDGTLMQCAAAALAAAVLRMLADRSQGAYGARVVLLVGPGDNGGDALWAGARLAGRGARVDALLTGERAHAGGLAALRAAGGRVHVAGEDQLRPLAQAQMVVDGLLGIGGRAGLSGRAGDLVAALPDGVPVVGVDLPSGVGPDDGGLGGAHVRADRTLTFGAAKPGLLLPPAAAVAGHVEVVDIGLQLPGPPAVERFEVADLAALWPIPGPDDDKYRRGVLGVVAGGPTYTGAAVLCAGAAVRCGAGMVRYVGPPAAADLVRSRWPEVVTGSGRVQAWVVGPGIDPQDDAQRAAALGALDSDLPCLVDAGALDLLPLHRPAPTLLTPHAGELARLLTRLEQGAQGPGVERADIEAAPLRHARRAGELTGATVLLKGAVSLVVSPDGRVRSQADGPHWLATAGSGDVLAGIAGTLLAAGLSPLDAGTVAIGLHGAAGYLASAGSPDGAEAGPGGPADVGRGGRADVGPGGPVSAGAVLDALPQAARRLLAQRGTPC